MSVTLNDPKAAGRWMIELMHDLYPLFRSLTGEGNRQTLATLAQHIPVRTHEVATGTRAFDWVVPREWRFRDAYVKDRTGRRIIDGRASNLHVVSNSVGVRRTMSLEELRPHLHTLPDRPQWAPYRHTYYAESWGFCLGQRDLDVVERESLGPYEVCIDADLIDGALTYGELTLPGLTDREILVSTHLCHPSLCNDNLSGLVVAAALAARMKDRARRHTWRFVFVPATLGPIVYLSRNASRVQRIDHGLVITGLGDPSPLTYKRSRRGNTAIDRIAAGMVSTRGGRTVDFTPIGYDERQYCSPGFDLPVGRLTRGEPGTYPQYHTSADDLSFMSVEALVESLEACESILLAADREELSPGRAAVRCGGEGQRYRNLHPHGEPQLGRRGVFDVLRREPDPNAAHLAVLWVLNLSDGDHDLDAIEQRSDMPRELIGRARDVLLEAGLLAPVERQAAVELPVGSLQ